MCVSFLHSKIPDTRSTYLDIDKFRNRALVLKEGQYRLHICLLKTLVHLLHYFRSQCYCDTCISIQVRSLSSIQMKLGQAIVLTGCSIDQLNLRFLLKTF